MTLKTLQSLSYAWLVMGVIVHITMFFITVPFGRHTSEKWGATINNKLAWFIMELPSLSIMTYFLFFGTNSFKSYVWVLFAFWIIHYFNRVWVYPFRIRPTPKRMPVAIMLSGISFNVINAGINGYFLAELASPEQYDKQWLTGIPFLVGAAMFVTGMLINWRADSILIHLRKPGETGYKIPRGFLFEYISSPNLFGEIIEWTGFALMAQNLPASTFFIWTLANLVPRAKNHHDWYHRNFAEYPAERRIVFPFVFKEQVELCVVTGELLLSGEFVNGSAGSPFLKTIRRYLTNTAFASNFALNCENFATKAPRLQEI